MAILDRFNRDELGHTIEVLVALLDIWDGDPDGEEGGDDEPLEANGDTQDSAWTEWPSRGRMKAKGQEQIDSTGNEDTELIGDETDIEQCEDDHAPNGRSFALCHEGPGCSIADPGGCEHDGREPDDDAESEQMHGDVPTLAVYSAEYNIFNDERTPLGMSNLTTSFVGQARSADTGADHKGRAPDRTSQPGVPV